MSRLTHWGKWNDISMNTVKINQVNCQTCNDPTKYIFALWDGPNGTHGKIYECHNMSCLTKRGREISNNIAEEERIAVVEENSRNNIQMLLIKMKRKDLQITTFKMAKLLGISPSDYSNYEMCRVVLPVEMVGRIDDVFKEQYRSRMENRMKEMYP